VAAFAKRKAGRGRSPSWAVVAPFLAGRGLVSAWCPGLSVSNRHILSTQLYDRSNGRRTPHNRGAYSGEADAKGTDRP